MTEQELAQIKVMLEEQLKARTAPAAIPTAWPTQPTAAPMGTAWPVAPGPMMPAGGPQPQAVMLRISIPMGGGELSGYLAFPPEVLLNPQLLSIVCQTYGITPYYPRRGFGGQRGFGGRY